MELAEILSGGTGAEPAATPEPAPAEPPASPQTGETPAPEPRDDTRQRDEHGRFVPKQQGEQEPAPPAGKQDHGQIPIAALLDEREKRQRAEQDREQYRRELEEHRRRAAPPQPRPDLFQDPDGALAHVERQVSEQVTRARLDMSVMMEQQAKPDYPEKEAAFIAAVQANPALYQQMMADPHPAGFAYRVGSQVLAMREIGDPASYKDRIVDDDALLERMLQKRGLSLQALSKLGAEQVRSPQPASPQYPNLPSSLSTARSAAPRSPAQASADDLPLAALGNPGLRMG
jgi:hypothetical protein